MRNRGIYKRITACAAAISLCAMPLCALATGNDVIISVDAPGSSGAENSSNTSAAASSQDEEDRRDIEDSRRKIEENKERLSELQSERGSIEDTLSALNDMKSDTVAYIQELDAKLDEINGQIDEINSMMSDTEDEIELTKAELELARASEEEQYSSMKLRIKYMYENSSINSLDVLLRSGSLSELLNRAEYMREVTEYDREKLDEYKITVQQVSDKEQELNEEYQSLEDMAAESENARKDIEKLQQDKQAELTAYEERINEAGADLSSMQASIEEIQAAVTAEENNIAAIEAEMRRREEEARKQAEASGQSYETVSIGDISFTWPIPGATRITSEFGGRESPTEGASTNHKGVDIGAPTGTPIVAAASGSVVISTYSASAGNYIMINHGGGVYTVYMHMSSRSVSVGDEVSKGETIGLCGSTGYSTGPHLHFGVRIDGSYVNPLNYVSP